MAAGRQFPANQNTVLQYHNFPQRMPLQLASKAFTPISLLYPIKLYLPYILFIAAGQQFPANQSIGLQNHMISF